MEAEERKKEADLIHASVNTPTKIKGVRVGRAADMRFSRAWDARWQSMPMAQRLSERTTVPVNHARALESVVQAYTGDHSIWALSNPGSSLASSAVTPLAGAAAAEVLADIRADWVHSGLEVVVVFFLSGWER